MADVKLNNYLQRFDQSDVAESTIGGSQVENLAEKIAVIRTRRSPCQDMLAQLDQTREGQISLTGLDSCAIAAHTHVAMT